MHGERPSLSHASISCSTRLQTSKGSPAHPPVAAAIASSSCARPSSTSLEETTAYPSCPRARSSRSESPTASAELSAASAYIAASDESRELFERARSSQPCSAPDATSRSRRSARASQPRAAASLPNTRAYSRESQSVIRAARPSWPSRLNPEYARSRQTMASRPSRSHHSDRPSPSSASGDSAVSTASSKAARASDHLPTVSAS